jgi:hypothetical protein
MKALILLILAASLNANAGDGTTSLCVNAAGEDIQFDPDAIDQEILSKSTCYEAKTVAQNCALGASGDVSTAGEAYDICDKELTSLKPSTENTDLLKTMVNTCDKAYENKEGTMYLSFNAFCKLEAISWIVNVTSGAQD